MSTKYLQPFADWLSVSYPSSLSPHQEIISIVNEIATMGYTSMGSGKELYQTDYHGSIFVTTRDNYTNVSISGSVLSLVREADAMNALVMALSSAPHNVTRLDIAYDTPLAGSLSLKKIQRTYPTGYAKLAGRSRQLQYVLAQTDSNTQTGTAYFQNSKYKGTIKLRVYDKAFEQLQNLNHVMSPTTRYELTVARGASIKDFLCPDACFWHFMPEELLKRPEKVSKWSATDRIDYDEHQSSLVTDYERLRYLIHNSPALSQLINTSASVTGGLKLLQREIAVLAAETDAGSSGVARKPATAQRGVEPH